MNAIIIEDELAATKLLTKIVEDYCPSLKITSKADSIESGVELINNSNPDLVFLDIRIKDRLSFDLLDQIKDQNFYLIITTAYDEYAVKAFKYNAIDYILKPYVPKDIVAAINRVKEREQSQQVFKKLNAMLDQSKREKRISLATGEGLRLCSTDEIIRLEASGAYCIVYLKQEKLIISKSLGEIEKQLPPDLFHRVHSGHTVNRKYVKSLKNADGGYLEMIDSTQVPIARRRKQNILEVLKTI